MKSRAAEGKKSKQNMKSVVVVQSDEKAQLHDEITRVINSRCTIGNVSNNQKVDELVSLLNGAKIKPECQYVPQLVTMSDPDEQNFMNKVKKEVEITSSFLISNQTKIMSQKSFSGTERMNYHLKRQALAPLNVDDPNSIIRSKYMKVEPDPKHVFSSNRGQIIFDDAQQSSPFGKATNVVTPIVLKTTSQHPHISRVRPGSFLPRPISVTNNSVVRLPSVGAEDNLPTPVDNSVSDLDGTANLSNAPRTPNNGALQRTMMDTPSLVKSIRMRLTGKIVTEV